MYFSTFAEVDKIHAWQNGFVGANFCNSSATLHGKDGPWLKNVMAQLDTDSVVLELLDDKQHRLKCKVTAVGEVTDRSAATLLLMVRVSACRNRKHNGC